MEVSMSTVPHHTQVVVAYDFSSSSETALHQAVDTCRADHTLHLVVVLDPHCGLPVLATEHPDEAYAHQIQTLAAQRFMAVRRPGAIEILVHVRIGEAGAEILALAEDVAADLVVIGSHGRTGVARAILGSISERVVREARCPVMVVRPKSYREAMSITADHELTAALRFDYAG
jgi:nucleotide-binding universal stress UspA family protein